MKHIQLRGIFTLILLLLPFISTPQKIFAASNPVSVTNSTSEHPTVLQGSGDSFHVDFTNTSDASSSALLDVEIYALGASSGPVKVFQAFEEKEFAGHEAFTASAALPSDAAPGMYVLKAGIFSPDWSQNFSWNDSLKTVYVLSAGQQAPDEVVDMTASSQSSQSINVEERNTFTASFLSKNTPNTVLADIEAYDSTNKKVFQEFHDVAFNFGEQKTLNVSVPALQSTGTYHWSVGIFTPGWGQLIHWYDSVQAFSMTQASVPMIPPTATSTPSNSTTTPPVLTATSTTPTLLPDIHISVQNSGIPDSSITLGQAFSVTPVLIADGNSPDFYAYLEVIGPNHVGGGGPPPPPNIYHGYTGDGDNGISLASGTPVSLTANVPGTARAGDYYVRLSTGYKKTTDSPYIRQTTDIGTINIVDPNHPIVIPPPAATSTNPVTSIVPPTATTTTLSTTTPQQPAQIQISLSGVDIPASPIPQGQSFTFTPSLVSAEPIPHAFTFTEFVGPINSTGGGPPAPPAMYYGYNNDVTLSPTPTAFPASIPATARPGIYQMSIFAGYFNGIATTTKNFSLGTTTIQ